jgi:putative mRNA 3-end processing factor
VSSQLERYASVNARGAVLLGATLTCDAHGPRPLRLVTHIHADHLHGLAASLRECEAVLATPLSKALLAVLKGRRRASRLRELACGQVLEREGETLELFPAGHIAGSAQVMLTTSDGVRVAYTGDLRSPPAPVLQADVLVTEATYGDPAYVRPFRAEVEGLFLELVRERLAQGPVCVVGFHGKLQEAAGLLRRAGIEAPILAPERVYQALQVCRRHDLEPGAGPGGGAALPSEGPAPQREGSPEAQAARAGAYIRLRHTALSGPVEEPTRILLSGWQFDTPCRRLNGGTWQVALSDHCDFTELLDYVRSSGARLVIADAFRSRTARVFAAEVERRLGVRAIAMP